jgi:hypothetical protein
MWSVLGVSVQRHVCGSVLPELRDLCSRWPWKAFLILLPPISVSRLRLVSKLSASSVMLSTQPERGAVC